MHRLTSLFLPVVLALPALIQVGAQDLISAVKSSSVPSPEQPSATSPTLPPSANPTNDTSTVLTPQFETFITNLLNAWGSPGGVAVVVVRQDSQGLWQTEIGGYGNATLDGRPVTEDTLFPIASNSKLFTVLATGLLISNESITPRITWDTPISTLIPEWGLQDPVASEMSVISDLMSHRTGLSRHDMMYSMNDTVESILSRTQYLMPSHTFRDRYQYNNIMYTALSSLPSRLLSSSPPLARYVKQHIFEPLGLNDTTYSLGVANATGFLADGLARTSLKCQAVIYSPWALREHYHIFSLWEGKTAMVAISGAGGIIMNAKDAAKWLQTLLMHGTNPTTNESVIPPEVVLKAASGISVLSAADTLLTFPEQSTLIYGGGQMSSGYRGHVVVEHDGGVPGYQTTIARLPNDNIGVAVFTNDDLYGVFLAQLIKYTVMDIALGLEPIDWNARIQSVVSFFFPGPPTAPRPSTPTPLSRNASTLAGTYTNTRYGTFELCYANVINTGVNTTSSSPCAELVNSINERLPGYLLREGEDVPTFVVQWNKMFAPNIVFRHFDGDVFNGTVFTAYPTGDDEMPYYTYPNIDSVNNGVRLEFAADTNSSESFGAGLVGIMGSRG